MKERLRKHGSGATALHAEGDDGFHFVGLDSIKVLLLNEDRVWIAQGLEIDYAAQGDTEKEVKERFERGLMKTIDAQLQVSGTIDGVLKVAPTEVWSQYFEAAKGKRLLYSQGSIHLVQPALSAASARRSPTAEMLSQRVEVEYLQPCMA